MQWLQWRIESLEYLSRQRTDRQCTYAITRGRFHLRSQHNPFFPQPIHLDLNCAMLEIDHHKALSFGWRKVILSFLRLGLRLRGAGEVPCYLTPLSSKTYGHSIWSRSVNLPPPTSSPHTIKCCIPMSQSLFLICLIGLGMVRDELAHRKSNGLCDVVLQ